MNRLEFQFPDSKSAMLAMDMLTEIGFHVKPVLRVGFDRGDLTSALEIAEAYGGSLDMADAHHRSPSGLPVSEREVFDTAYQLAGGEGTGTFEDLRVPAHTVTEDLPEAYLHPDVEAPHLEGTAAVSEAETADTPSFDPSNDDFDHLEPGVHL
ncbi:hypothetical protein [Gorillibacterium sp. CAU 1737]|uniref:hypothetical protein n=1 Tax=Gorillibacterium sp. CAU 1737 TaxID=3140362 RepID=UPI00326085A6